MTNGRETYGIGEWYGRLLTSMGPEERRRLANARDMECPFRSTAEERQPCTKQGGVCSIRKYVATDGGAQPAPGVEGTLCTTCPYRFEEGRAIYAWIGETLLGTPSPIVLGEFGFLRSPEGQYVGQIDGILVHPRLDPLNWCALEKQAVYFSGDSMGREFTQLGRSAATTLPFPAGRRRPDFRSSGPKRLMPQLQIKVPTLRRWGRKMAVVVDESFFGAMGRMEQVDHVSNGDILWFVVGYAETIGAMTLVPRNVYVTTLESSVVGLTAGEPVSKEDFETAIRERVNGGAA